MKATIIGAKGLSFKSWSMTRLYDYDRCPLFAKLKHLDKMCPMCFKGKIKGGYDTPAVCEGGCGEVVEKAAALERGSAVGGTLEYYVKGEIEAVHEDITHPKVLKLAKDLRKDYAAKKVLVEKMWNLDRNWKLLPPRWSPQVWLIVKTDVFRFISKTKARVTDWKTGGVDKRNGNKPYSNNNYGEQLRIYSTAGLCAFPEITEVQSDLCFVDTGPKHNPIVEMKEGNIKRADLEKHKKALANRALPLFEDTSFAPKANDKCSYCDYSKGKGGPCPF